MKPSLKILSLVFMVVSCVTLLVMLVTSFEQYEEQYFPAFMTAQKFGLPLLVLPLALVFLVFFEPEHLANKKVVVTLRILFALLFAAFAYYVLTLNFSKISFIVIGLYILQLLFIAVINFELLFSLKVPTTERNT